MIFVRSLGKALEWFAAALAILGGLGLLFAIGITVVSVTLKMTRRALDYFLSDPFDPASWSHISSILGEEELVQYAVGVALFAAIPWVTIKRGHVRIDIFEPYFSGLINRLLDFLADLSLLFVAYMILTRQWYLIFKKARRKQEPTIDMLMSANWEGAWSRVRLNYESQILGLKLWPFYMIAEFCIAVFLLVALFCSLRSLLALFLPAANPVEGAAV